MGAWDKQGPHMRAVLTEMCRRVGALPSDIDFDSPEWYRSRTWSEEQAEEFKAWLAGYLMGNNGARHELMQWPRKSRKYCRKVADEFDFMWGWGCR